MTTIYREDNTLKLIESGEYKNFKYWITSNGLHPCAYIQIPSNHPIYKIPFFKSEYSYILEVHGGITFSSNCFRFSDSTGWFIGWDYAHFGDYMKFCTESGHKYTIEEIKKDIRRGIRNLVKMADDKKNKKRNYFEGGEAKWIEK